VVLPSASHAAFAAGDVIRILEQGMDLLKIRNKSFLETTPVNMPFLFTTNMDPTSSRNN
jgi:hypothetical protein